MSKRAAASVVLPLLTAVVTLSLFIASLAFPSAVSAAPLDQALCEDPTGLNGSWDAGSETCSIASGDTGTIPSGTTVEVYSQYQLSVQSGATLNVYGVLDLWGGRLDLSGTANVQSGGIIDCRGDPPNASHGGTEVYGTLNINSGGQYIMNGGTTYGGFMDINSGGAVYNYGNIETASPADWFIDGTLHNYGSTIVRGPAEVNLQGTIDNHSSANLYIYGHINGMPYEALYNRSGAHIYLYNTAVEDQGLLFLTNGFVFQNQGTIDVNANCTVSTAGTFNNEGTIFNYGQWTASNRLTNSYSGVFHNYGSVSLEYAFDNYGQMDGYGSWDLMYDHAGNNYRTLSMTGAVNLSQSFDLVNGVTGTMTIGYLVTTGIAGGSIQNSGQLDIDSGARIDLNSSSYLMNKPGGVVDHYGWVTSTVSILNSGTYYKHCGAVLVAPGVQGDPVIDLCVGTIRVIKSALGGDGVFDYTATGGGMTSSFSITTTVGSGSRDLTGLTANKLYTITEATEPGWTLTNMSVQGAVGTSVLDYVSRRMIVNLGEGGTITCTFTNTKKGQLTILKETLPDGDPTWFPFSALGWGFSLRDGHWFRTDAAPGTYFVTETLVSGWMTPTITCSDTDSTGSGYIATARIAAGEWVTCTFTNAKRARLTIDKAVVPSPNSTLFRFDLLYVGIFMGESDLLSADNLAPGEHRVTETVTSGWQLTGLSCSDDNSYLSGTTAVYVLEPGEWVTCTFTNTMLSHLTLLKETVPDGDPTYFHFEGPDQLPFDLKDGESWVTLYPSGSRWFTETAKTGWQTPQITCSDTDSVGSGYRVEYNLDPGEWVTCTFTNVMGPDLAITKAAQPAALYPGQYLTYVLSYSNHGQTTATGVWITDVLSAELENVSVASQGQTITATQSSPRVWQVQDLPPGASGTITITARLRWQCVFSSWTLNNQASIGCSSAEANTTDNSSSSSQTVQVTDLPSASFDSNETDGCAPVAVDFSDTSAPGSARISSWRWTFGDGASSLEQNPTHSYSSAGQFDVGLTVTDSNGCSSSLVSRQYVSVYSVAADFGVSAPTACAPAVETFTNNSSVSGGTWQGQYWEFGDGATSSDWSPTHTYSCPGVYTVTLAVQSTLGCYDVHRETVTINSCLEIVKIDRVDPVPATRRIEYEITLRNTSAAMYDRVVVTDTLPAGTYFLPYIPENAGWHEAGGRVITRELTSVAAGATVHMRLNAGTHSTARGPVTNEITARWGCVSAWDSETTTINPPVVEPTPVPTPTPTPAPGAGTEVLQSGSGSDNLDTYIYRYQPGANYALSPLLRVGYRRNFSALLRFDLAAIPQGAVIDDAKLELYAAGWSGADITVGAYAISSTMMISETTWNQPLGSAWWSLGGANDVFGDRREIPEDELTTRGPLQWYGWDLTSLVQQWLVDLPNNGVILRQSVYDNGSFHFASAEYSNAGLRPRLVIHYH